MMKPAAPPTFIACEPAHRQQEIGEQDEEGAGPAGDLDR